MTKEKMTYEEVVEQGLGKNFGEMVGQFLLAMPLMAIVKHCAECPDCAPKFKQIEAHAGHPVKALLVKGEKKP